MTKKQKAAISIMYDFCLLSSHFEHFMRHENDFLGNIVVKEGLYDLERDIVQQFKTFEEFAKTAKKALDIINSKRIRKIRAKLNKKK